MSSIVTVVTPLNPDRILPAKLSLSKEMFIFLKAGSYNRSVALPRSMCTLKSLIHRVSTSTSWGGAITLDGLIRGNDIRPSIGLMALLLSRM